jgi:GNAT superfamily N-acetyltransferase
MKNAHALEVAVLLNTRNQLQYTYTAEMVLADADNYLLELDGDEVVACVEINKVQWYQWELRHLSVIEAREGMGLGKKLIKRAEDKARKGRARIVQCTIEVGNDNSENAFGRSGYHKSCRFYNERTERDVAVWQKVLDGRPKPGAKRDRGTNPRLQS